MNLHNQPFLHIKQGSKTVEMRLFDQRRQGIVVGDFIEFTNRANNESIVVSVTAVQTFENFEQLYANFDKVSLGYDINDVANPADMLLYYTAEDVARYGVVAISVQVA